MNRPLIPAAILATALFATPAFADDVPLAPHRAVYDMKLADTDNGSVEDITGRLVFEITGNECEGYVMNTRFVLNTALESRTILNDFQSSTWEDPKESAFRFISKDYVDNELSEETNGTAAKERNTVQVSFTVPEEKTVELKGDALFPVQHIQKLIRAARKGETVFQSPLYDGTDGGEKIYNTTAIIGAPFAADVFRGKSTPADGVVKTSERWPVVMSYFDDTSENADDGLPIYQMAFELYDNGITRSLTLDYGDFKLDGQMSQFEMLEPSKCE
ncbi:MAG: cell envelope integrity EipB family protein [Rhodobiaceae bacterium]|nr:cell envelope integrity EipB family protein [Rhodobiaceae bacterium]